MFGDHDPTEQAAETEDRWGDTAANRESQRRTSAYRKGDWLRLKAEGEAIEHRLAGALAGAVAVDGPEAMAVAEEHRQHISRWFYDCSYDMHRCLAEMYVADPSFAAHYDDIAPGLARYTRDAIMANAALAAER